MKKIKIAQIGYGYWGKNILRNLMSIPNIEVVEVCDENNDKRVEVSKMYPNLPITNRYLDILDRADAIIIATPPNTHYKIAKESLLRNKHVFVEKPMTTKIKEARELIEIAKEKNKVLMVGHTFVYIPAINDIKRLIDNGELGKIYYIDFVMTNLGKYQRNNILLDLAPHGISIILHLLGNPEVVDVKVNGISAIQKGLLDVAYLTLYFKDSFANMHFSWLNPNKERRLTVVGSKKMVVFNDIEPLEKIRIYDKGIKRTKNFSSWGESIVGYRHGDIVIPNTTPGEPLKIELKHFVDCILNNKVPITDGKNGLKIVEVIERANNQL